MPITYSTNLSNSLIALLLVVVANSTPWLAGRLWGRESLPLDGGLTLWDGQRLFGDHKTWRGLAIGSVVTALVALLFGKSFWLGLGFGALSLVGDAFSSCVKRRLNLKPGSDVTGLDQLPEALLPTLIFASPLQLDWRGCVTVALTFMLLNRVLIGLRRRSKPN